MSNLAARPLRTFAQLGLSQRSGAVILITVLQDAIATAIFIPVLPTLLRGLLGSGDHDVALWMGLLLSCSALAQLVFSPIVGVLSDRFGRKPVLLVSAIGLGADYLVMALAPNVLWLALGRFLSGVTTATIPTAFAYVVDATAPEQRAKWFGLVGGALGGGIVLGPVVGALLGHIDIRAPFWGAALLSFVNSCAILMFLPESLPPERRISRELPIFAPSQLKGAFVNGALARIIAVYALCQLAHAGFAATFIVYGEVRYGLSYLDMAVLLSVNGLLSIVSQSILAPWLARISGNLRTLFAGLAFGLIGFSTMAAATTTWVFEAAIPAAAFSGLVWPALQGLIAERVPSELQGRVQGLVNSGMGVANLVGPIGFSYVMAATLGMGLDRSGYGAVQFSVAGAYLLAAVVGTRLTRAVNSTDRVETIARSEAPAVSSPTEQKACTSNPEAIEAIAERLFGCSAVVQELQRLVDQIRCGRHAYQNLSTRISGVDFGSVMFTILLPSFGDGLDEDPQQLSRRIYNRYCCYNNVKRTSEGLEINCLLEAPAARNGKTTAGRLLPFSDLREVALKINKIALSAASRPPNRSNILTSSSSVTAAGRSAEGRN